MDPTTIARETRVISSTLEVRAALNADEPSRTIRGYAAKFNTLSQPLSNKTSKYVFFETIVPGAFDGALFTDVRALFNHDHNIVLARSKEGAGTLKLGVDDTGLWYEFEAPNTTAGNDLLELVKRGDIDQSSFAFSIAEGGQTWEESGTNSPGAPVTYKRTITKIAAVYDVSPVTEPAYTDTSVAVRSLERATKSSKADPVELERIKISLAHRQRALGLK